MDNDKFLEKGAYSVPVTGSRADLIWKQQQHYQYHDYIICQFVIYYN